MKKWFSRKPKTKADVFAATMFDTLIGKENKIQGDLSFTKCARIEGNVFGNVRPADVGPFFDSVVVTGARSVIEGNIEAVAVQIGGLVRGNVEAQNVHIVAGAVVEGDVFYETIQIDDGATVRGRLQRDEIVAMPPGGITSDAS